MKLPVNTKGATVRENNGVGEGLTTYARAVHTLTHTKKEKMIFCFLFVQVKKYKVSPSLHLNPINDLTQTHKYRRYSSHVTTNTHIHTHTQTHTHSHASWPTKTWTQTENDYE